MTGPGSTRTVTRVAWQRGDPTAVLTDREWLVANGLGGYASGTVGGTPTRRYHGVLIAALPVPLGRMVMLTDVVDEVLAEDGSTRALASVLAAFRLEQGLPVWTFTWGDHELEKRVLMPHAENTTYVIYRRVSGSGGLRLVLTPRLQVRRLDEPVSAAGATLVLASDGDRHEVRIGGGVPALRLRLSGGAATVAGGADTMQHFYASEAARGYDAQGALWSPGTLCVEFDAASTAALVASTEPWEVVEAATPARALAMELRRRDALLEHSGQSVAGDAARELVLASDQFVTRLPGTVDARPSSYAADELRTVIAGYHWFTDWGRDTMISLEGLTLVTGRFDDAARILHRFARHVRRGLIPNLFPDGSAGGLYNTADATLWFIHAVHRYVVRTGDLRTLAALMPVLHDVIAWHVRGTDFHIGVDPADGLLRQGEEGYQLTWMDAKVGDWVVTPRRGKAVEIQALWYNALRLVEGWTRDVDHDAETAARYTAMAEHARSSFNERFWFATGGYLYDVVDGESGADDTCCRPNQVFALSLEHPVLAREHWQAVLDVVTERLLTPVGLRSLAPGSPGYHARYDGDVRARDAAYHQGTVWGWLIGPYIDAWVRVHGDPVAARPLLDGLLAHLGEAGVGQMSEIFDAEPPYTPRGCIAQAWTVAEVMRSLEMTAAGGGASLAQPSDDAAP